MDRSSSDQREAWGLGESETAPQRTPAAISSSRPRDHLASSKRRLASPGSTRHPARGQQRFCEFVTQPPGTRGSWGVSRRRTAVVPPAARPSRHTSGQWIPMREHGRRRTHRSGAPVSAFLRAPPRWSTLVDLGCQASTKRIRIIAQPDRLSGETSSVFSTRRTLEKSMQS